MALTLLDILKIVCCCTGESKGHSPCFPCPLCDAPVTRCCSIEKLVFPSSKGVPCSTHLTRLSLFEYDPLLLLCKDKEN